VQLTACIDKRDFLQGGANYLHVKRRDFVVINVAEDSNVIAV
jgi:hypothetical protein